MSEIPDILSKFPALKELYPDDIETIEAEEKRVTKLLADFKFYERPETQALIELCKRDVVAARLKLATDRSLMDNSVAQAELWAIIDARLWFLERVAQNYSVQLDFIAADLEAQLKK